MKIAYIILISLLIVLAGCSTTKTSKDAMDDSSDIPAGNDSPDVNEDLEGIQSDLDAFEADLQADDLNAMGQDFDV